MLARRVAPLLVLFLTFTAAASGAIAQDRPGLGFAFVPRDAGLLVTVLADDGPASGAGLLEGDLVTAVAGKNMAGLEPSAIGQWIGLVGSGIIPVVLDVERTDGPTQVEITPMPYSRDALQAKVEARANASPLSLPNLNTLGSALEASAPEASGAGCIAGDCTDGTGTWRYASGATYTGAFQNGVRHGRGTHTFANGMTFVGDWVDDDRVRGREVYASGDTYDGEYLSDKRHGQGTYTWASGKVYVGAWMAGKRHGRGTVTYTDGDTYSGLWREGQRHGQATYTFANGMTFIGEWENDARARGRETFTDGRVYEGEYANDTRHGQGTMTYPDGRVETGLWRDGDFAEAQASPAAAAPEAAVASGDPFADAIAELDAAMRDSPTPRRASREGGRLVVRSERCTIEFPVTPTTQAEPSDTSALHFYIATSNHDVTCGPTLSVSRRSNFDFASTPARDRALRAARAVLSAWASGADTGPTPPVAAAPEASGGAASGDRCTAGNCQDGTGTRTYASGQTFTGTFRGGKEVHGRLTMTGGDVYDGAFNAEGKFHGRGLYTFGPGDYEGHTFEGAFADGAPTSGTYTWDSGQTYTGDWDGWVRTGTGTMVYANGNRYEGLWRDGKRHGTGTFTWPEGTVFTGDWVEGERVRGRETHANWNVYEGEYAGDRRHGTGTMTYASGNVYTGEWVAGDRSGQGTFTWADGKVYTGAWADDDRHGEGVMTWPDGQRHEGTYKSDVRSGPGTMTYPDGRVFAGTFAENRPAEGVLTRPGGSPRPVRNEGGTFVYTD